MSSEVEICNLALSHLGDSATVASIDPPEGSSQAEHCQRWYPVARDALLEMGEWNFATSRAVLAELNNPYQQWQHTYAVPADCLKVLEIISVDAPGDLTASFDQDRFSANSWIPGVAYAYTPQNYSVEMDIASGAQVILTNVPQAMIRYTRKVTDTARFSPLFGAALARYLAHYLAGPVLKGETGMNVGQGQLQIAMQMLSMAAVSGANQSQRQQVQNYPWVR